MELTALPFNSGEHVENPVALGGDDWRGRHKIGGSSRYCPEFSRVRA